LGFLFKFKGQYQVAAEWFRKAIEARPHDADGYKEARESFTRALEIDPKYQAAQDALDEIENALTYS
jgi:tetratricopeptide (TPR) repeat protein